METIFDYIKKEEVKYGKPVELADGWYWSMKQHLNRSYLYLNSQFEEDNDNRTLRPFKNIVTPILNIQYRTEGFDVKDIELYVDNKDEYFKSLLVRKFHNKWSLENGIDAFIDEMVESYCDYGGVLVRKTKNAQPEVIDLRTIAFCNQQDLLNNPFAIRHEFSFSQLREKAEDYSWGSEGSDIDIEDLIQLVKKQDKDTVEVYEIHGNLPVEWLNDEDIVEISKKDVQQIQVVAFYHDMDNNRQYVTLFRKRMPKLPFKFKKRDRRQNHNRALGVGGVEEIFEGQIWTNWNEVKITEMLDAASKTLYKTTDPTFKSRNNLNNAENNEVFILQEGKDVGQIDTFPRNLAVFNDSVERFWQHAQLVGAAPEALIGEAPTSGTPFKLYEAQQMEGKSLHKYRQGQLAEFMDEIYRDWILPHLGREICNEQKFMQELSADEMQTVVDAVVTKKSNEFKKRMILSMQDVDDELVALYENEVRQETLKKGTKWFFEILKDEMKNVELSVMTNIAGKQKNLALLTDKLVNVLRQYIATPQIRQDPEMTKLLNTILESSGLSPILYGGISPIQAQPSTATQPLQAVSEANMQQNVQ